MRFDEILDRWEGVADMDFFMPAYENLGKEKEKLDYSIIKKKIECLGFPINDNRVYSISLENDRTYSVGGKYENEIILIIFESDRDILIVTPSKGFIINDEPLIFRRYEVKGIIYFRDANSSKNIL